MSAPKECKTRIVDAVTEKSAEKLGKKNPELIAQTEIDTNLASLKALMKEKGGIGAIMESIDEISKKNWVKKCGVTVETIRRWIFEKGNGADKINVKYHESGIITENHSISTIETVGLKPCVGVILEAIDQNGKKVACMLHFAPQFLNKSPEEQKQHLVITRELLQEGLAKMKEAGVNIDDLSGFRAILSGESEHKNKQWENMTPAERNACNVIKILNEKGITKIEENYNPEIDYRTLNYNIKTGEYVIKPDEDKKEKGFKKTSESAKDSIRELRIMFAKNPSYQLVNISFDELINFIKQDNPNLRIEIGKTEKLTPLKYIKEIAENTQLREYVNFLKSVSAYKFEILNVEGLKKMMQEHPMNDFKNLSKEKSEVLRNTETLQNINYLFDCKEIESDKQKLINSIIVLLGEDYKDKSIFERGGKRIIISKKSEAYSSLDEFGKMSIVDLNKILLLLSNLQKPDFRGQIGDLILDDLKEENNNTELGGLMFLGSNKDGISIQEIESPAEFRHGDSSYTGSRTDEFIQNHNNAMFDWHIHAIKLMNDNKAPSVNDITGYRQKKVSGIVITSYGEGEFLVHFCDNNGNAAFLGKYEYKKNQ